jgi:hypothetical protein
MDFNVGDVVIAHGDDLLYSGSSIYSHAICVQANPLVLVSESADMRWESTLRFKTLQKIGVATPEQLAICMKRL